MSRRPYTALLAGLFLLSACTANDQNVTRGQGAGAGAAIGAGLGALIGDDPEDILLGAAVGGIVGLAAGEAVARKKASYASTEDMIVKERRLVTEQTDALLLYNAGLERDLGALNRSIAELEGEVVRTRSDRRARNNLRQRAEADLGEAKQRLAEVNQEIDVSRNLYDQARRGAEVVDLADWDRRIRELERRRDNLVFLIGDFETSTKRIV